MTAILPSLSSFPPFFDIGGGGLLHPRHHSGNGSMTQLEILCPGCEMPLWECDFNSTHYRIFCDNFKCRLFKQNQDSRAKNPQTSQSPKRYASLDIRWGLSNYQLSLEERKARYRFARNLGCSPRRAMELRGMPIEEIEELVGVKVEA